MACQITNNSDLKLNGFEEMIQSLVAFSQDRFGFEKPPSLFLNSDSSNAENPLGKTAYYDPQSQEIHIYVDGRHPKDIMRSISHELIHHKQNIDGELDGDYYHGEGYAQQDGHMRKMEKQAYLNGNMCFRDWEDGYKQNETIYNEWRDNKMSLKEWKNNELFGLLANKWGFGKSLVTEGKEITHMCALKVTHKETGQVGHPIKHTLTESGKISHYTVEFNKVIVENIAVENLDIMVQEEHTHKRDDEKPHSEEKPVVNEKELEEASKDPLDLLVDEIRNMLSHRPEELKKFLSQSCTDLSEDNFNGLSERINQLSEEVSEQQFASINEIMTELKEGKSESVISEYGVGTRNPYGDDLETAYLEKAARERAIARGEIPPDPEPEPKPEPEPPIVRKPLEEEQLDPDKFYLIDGGKVYGGPFDSYEQAEAAMDIVGLQIKSPKPKFSDGKIAADKARAAKFGLEEEETLKEAIRKRFTRLLK